MEPRYFVTVHAPDARALRALAGFDLDLFQATARAADEGPHIEGLIALADVARLVDAGYRVTVEEPAHARARAHRTASLAEWLTETGMV